MSLKSLVSPVLPNFPQVTPDTEVEVLRDIPVETLYLALKDADAELVHWFFRNALPRQVQGLIDVDCWQGDEFLGERYELFFRSLVSLPPVKLAEYMKQLDSEIVVRGLMEHIEVRDFDRHEPIDLPERSFMLTPDSKFVLLLKTDDPETREVLFQWMNKLAAADLEHMRRILESLKWEQASDLEDFAYRMKKGRLEEMGFVDYHEALGLYARGNTTDEKKRLLENPLEPETKTSSMRSAAEADEDGDESAAAVHTEFLPDVISGPIGQDGLLQDAFRGVTDVRLREILLMELLRTVNGALSADKLLHGSVAQIGLATVRTRRYLDLGLMLLSDGSVERATETLSRQRLDDVFRLGWLAVQDLVKAATELVGKPGPGGASKAQLFHENDIALLQALSGRHPEITREVLLDLGVDGDTWMRPEILLRVGLRLAQLASIAKYLVENLGPALRLIESPPTAFDTALGRLMAGLVRQASGLDFVTTPITSAEWPQLVKGFRADALEQAVQVAASRCPEPGRAHLLARLKATADDVRFQFTNAGARLPDRRFFKGLSLEGTSKPADGKNPKDFN